MALFKQLRGKRVDLDAQELHDGYAYFCVDDGTFHIDYADADGNLQRKQINAKDAETLDGMSLEELKTEVGVQPDWLQTDSTKLDYIKNKPAFSNQYLTLIDQVNGFEYLIQMFNGNMVSYCRAESIEVTTPPNKIGYMEGDAIDTTGMVISAICQDGSKREISNYTYSPTIMTADTTQLDIQYVECGQVYTTSTTISIKGIADLLADFTFTANSDGTYTITSWNETLDGQPSTEFIVPDSDRIIV